MYKDYNLHAPKLRYLLWSFHDFLTNSSGCSISALVAYRFNTGNYMHPIPSDISSVRGDSTNKMKKVPYNILDCEYWWELKSWMLNTEYRHWSRLNKSLNYVANNDSTKNTLRCPHPAHGLSKSPHCSSHISSMLSVLKRNSIWDKKRKD